MASKAKLVTRTATSSSVTTDNIAKDSALTHAELDSNLINLRDQTIGIVADDSATIDIKVDIGDDKAWQSAFEEAARSAYSLQSLIQQFQTPIAIGIVIICCFVGFAVIWTRLGAIC